MKRYTVILLLVIFYTKGHAQVDIIKACHEISQDLSCGPEQSHAQIDSFLPFQQKHANLLELGAFTKDLNIKKNLFKQMHEAHLQNLKKTGESIIKYSKNINPGELVNKLNTKIAEVNQVCKVLKSNRDKVPNLIDPDMVRNSQVVIRGNQASNGINGIQKKVQGEIKEAELLYDQVVEPTVKNILNNFFSDPDLKNLVASPHFSTETKLAKYTKNGGLINILFPKSLSQKCIESGQIMNPVTPEIITKSINELIDKVSEGIDSEILRAKEINGAASNQNQIKLLNDNLKYYIEYAPMSISNSFESNDKEVKKVLCNLINETIGDEESRQNLNRILSNIGLGMSLVAIPLSFGTSSYLIPLIFVSSSALQVGVAANNIGHELNSNKGHNDLYLSGGVESQEYIDRQSPARLAIISNASTALLSLASSALYVKTFNPKVATPGKGLVASEVKSSGILDNLSSAQRNSYNQITASLKQIEEQNLRRKMILLKTPEDIDEFIKIATSGPSITFDFLDNAILNVYNRTHIPAQVLNTNLITTTRGTSSNSFDLIVRNPADGNKVVLHSQLEHEKILISSQTVPEDALVLRSPNFPSGYADEYGSYVAVTALNEAKKRNIGTLIIVDELDSPIYRTLLKEPFVESRNLLIKGKTQRVYVLKTNKIKPSNFTAFNNFASDLERINFSKLIESVNSNLNKKYPNVIFNVSGDKISAGTSNVVGEINLSKAVTSFKPDNGASVYSVQYTDEASGLAMPKAHNVSYVVKPAFDSDDLWVKTIIDKAKANPDKVIISEPISELTAIDIQRWKILENNGLAIRKNVIDNSAFKKQVVIYTMNLN